MDKYTQVLEFFMENGVQLTTEQMDELRTICEVSKDQATHINNRIYGMIGDGYDNKAIRKYNKDATKQADLASMAYNRGDKVNGNIREDKAKELLYDALDKDENAAYKDNELLKNSLKDGEQAYNIMKQSIQKYH